MVVARDRTRQARAGEPVQMPPLALECIEAAADAGLHYVRDDAPGLRRRRQGRSFSYVDGRGHVLRDVETIARIRSLAIPPAWSDVWICADPLGHLQATGRDARGRKQYRYHPRFRAHRDESKFHRLAAFARALPKIREGVERDLKKRALCRDKVMATVVKLLELTRIRVGNEEYVRENGPYGLTTLVSEQARVTKDGVRFRFKGKSGVLHDVTVKDARLVRTIKACQDLPGEELFQWLDDDGAAHRVRSDDVNDYIRSIAGAAFTAKDFRTWAGTMHAAITLLHENLAPCATQRDRKKCVVRAIERTAAELRNRAATCRKYYVHPAVLAAFEDDTLRERLAPAIALVDVDGAADVTDVVVDLAARGLSGQELAVVQLIEAAHAASATWSGRRSRRSRRRAPHQRERVPRQPERAPRVATSSRASNRKSSTSTRTRTPNRESRARGHARHGRSTRSSRAR